MSWWHWIRYNLVVICQNVITQVVKELSIFSFLVRFMEISSLDHSPIQIPTSDLTWFQVQGRLLPRQTRWTLPLWVCLVVTDDWLIHHCIEPWSMMVVNPNLLTDLYYMAQLFRLYNVLYCLYLYNWKCFYDYDFMFLNISCITSVWYLELWDSKDFVFPGADMTSPWRLKIAFNSGLKVEKGEVVENPYYFNGLIPFFKKFLRQPFPHASFTSNGHLLRQEVTKDV